MLISFALVGKNSLLASEPGSRADHKNTSPKLATRSLNAKKHTVLYVDDNAANLLLVQRIMRLRADIDLSCAMNGKGGLSMVKELRPDLVLLDLQMPDLPGDQILQALKSDAATREIPVVMVSGDVNPAHHKKAAEHHAAGNHEKAAHHAHTARGHHEQSAEHAKEASKHHVAEHGAK